MTPMQAAQIVIQAVRLDREFPGTPVSLPTRFGWVRVSPAPYRHTCSHIVPWAFLPKGYPQPKPICDHCEWRYWEQWADMWRHLAGMMAAMESPTDRAMRIANDDERSHP